MSTSKATPTKKRAYKVTVDGKAVEVPLSDSLYTHWYEQFQSKSGKLADARKRTLRNLIQAAYRQGLADAVKKLSG